MYREPAPRARRCSSSRSTRRTARPRRRPAVASRTAASTSSGRAALSAVVFPNHCSGQPDRAGEGAALHALRPRRVRRRRARAPRRARPQACAAGQLRHLAGRLRRQPTTAPAALAKPASATVRSCRAACRRRARQRASTAASSRTAAAARSIAARARAACHVDRPRLAPGVRLRVRRLRRRVRVPARLRPGRLLAAAPARGDSCVPALPAGLDCGFVSDGCDGSLLRHLRRRRSLRRRRRPTCATSPTAIRSTATTSAPSAACIGDGCGAAVTCGPCPPGRPAASAARPTSARAASRARCADAGAECGIIGDGCGDVIDCGPCPAGRCAAPSSQPVRQRRDCKPPSCADAGARVRPRSATAAAAGRLRRRAPRASCAASSAPYQCGAAPACTPRDVRGRSARSAALIGDGCGTSTAAMPERRCGTSEQVLAVTLRFF